MSAFCHIRSDFLCPNGSMRPPRNFCDPTGKTKAARGDADLSPRWREAVDELGKLRDALAVGEPVENHFRVDVVAPDPALSEWLAALRLERERLGLSLGEVARRTGIDTGDLSRLENGKLPDPRSSTRRATLGCSGNDCRGPWKKRSDGRSRATESETGQTPQRATPGRGDLRPPWGLNQGLAEETPPARRGRTWRA
jgi:hypothetical protein